MYKETMIKAKDSLLKELKANRELYQVVLTGLENGSERAGILQDSNNRKTQIEQEIRYIDNKIKVVK